jgi:hypothetical protein
MRLLISLGFVAAAMALAGCTAATPAYSASERFAQIHRNDVFQAEVANDDIDHFLESRPSNQLSIWNVYHRD